MQLYELKMAVLLRTGETTSETFHIVANFGESALTEARIQALRKNDCWGVNVEEIRILHRVDFISSLLTQNVEGTEDDVSADND
jgi:hypothetical protein